MIRKRHINPPVGVIWLPLWTIVFGLLCGVGCGVGVPAASAPIQTVVVTDSFVSQRFLPDGYLEFLGGVSEEARIEDIRDRKDWTRLEAAVVSVGFIDGAYWGRLAIQNNADISMNVFFASEYAFLDEFWVYHLDSEKELLSEIHLGDTKPFSILSDKYN